MTIRFVSTLNLNSSGGGGTTDNTTDERIPYKKASTTSFEDSPFRFDVANNKIVSDVTIEVPPGTVQVGEGLEISAAGVIPIFRSGLTGIQYFGVFYEVDDTGSQKPFTIDFDAEETVVPQPDFSTSIPLTGTFNNTVSANEIINEFAIKTDPGATLTGARIQFVSQTTGNPIFYYPSKKDWEDGIGADLVADGSGIVRLDIRDTPLGLLVGETIINNYAIDSGVLYGNSSNIPYQEIVRQVGTFKELVDESDSVTKLSDVSDAGSGAIITDAERTKLGSLTGGRYLGVFADLTALQTAHPTAVAGDTATVTSPNGNLFYWNVSAWADSGTGYFGNMLKAEYDPTNIEGDAFSMGNMSETTTAKVFSDVERTKLAGIEDNAEVNNISDIDATALTGGGNTALHYHDSDRDRANHTGTQLHTTISDYDTELAGTANTASYTPTTDYHPATKKYVDDNAGGSINTMTITPTANIENLDVSSLSPLGVLFVDNDANRELRSLAGGTHGDIIHLVHISDDDLKIKDPDSYTGQQIETPGSADRVLIDFGGCTLVYNSSKDLWFATGLYY